MNVNSSCIALTNLCNYKNSSHYKLFFSPSGVIFNSLRIHSMELSFLEYLVLPQIALQLTTANGTPKFRYHVRKISPLVYAPGLLTPLLEKIRPNIVFLCTPRSSLWPSPLHIFNTRLCTPFSSPSSSRPPSFDRPNSISWSTRMKF
jgi:hypothetical protein